jgi:hypothetical protein
MGLDNRATDNALRGLCAARRQAEGPVQEVADDSGPAASVGLNSAEAAKNAVGLEECGASFEASLREAPQDEAFLFMILAMCLMLRSDAAERGRVSKHVRRPMQSILAFRHSSLRAA